jgi:hypothetical protein
MNVGLLRTKAAALGFVVMATGVFAQAVTPSLQTYAAPDKSASAGVPAGWKVTKAAYGVILMSGPQGEQIGLGAGVIAHNGAFQAGASAPAPIGITMPNQANLGQKLMMVFAQAAAQKGEAMPQVNIVSATPIGISPQIAQCGTFLGAMTTQQGTSKFETQFCSMAMDSNGFYKVIWKMATIPAAQATQERATAEAVLHSYKISMASLKQLLQPLTPKMQMPRSTGGGMGGGGGGGMSPGDINGEIGADHSAICMDEGVIREEPERLLPSYCR